MNAWEKLGLAIFIMGVVGYFHTTGVAQWVDFGAWVIGLNLFMWRGAKK